MNQASSALWGRGRAVNGPANLSASLTEANRDALGEVEAPDVWVGHRDADTLTLIIALEELAREPVVL